MLYKIIYSLVCLNPLGSPHCHLPIYKLKKGFYLFNLLPTVDYITPLPQRISCEADDPRCIMKK